MPKQHTFISDGYVRMLNEKWPPLPCPDCSGMLVLRKSKYGLFYGCVNYPYCTAAHGAHPDGSPLGVPADKGTKEARIAAHAAFDKLWKGEDAPFKREDAYKWLKDKMGLSSEECHIGRFDKDTCKKVVDVCREGGLM